MRRDLGDGFELDDDPARIDRDVVHAYLTRSYWAEGRSREVQDALIDGSARVVGLCHGDEQVGFSRTLSDGHVQSYLADVYVLEEHRDGASASRSYASRWTRGRSQGRSGICTRATHDLYREFGFGKPSERVLERSDV